MVHAKEFEVREEKKRVVEQDDYKAMFQTLRSSIKALQLRLIELEGQLVEVRGEEQTLKNKLAEEMKRKEQVNERHSNGQAALQNLEIMLKENQNNLQFLRAEHQRQVKDLERRQRDGKLRREELEREEQLLTKRGRFFVQSMWDMEGQYGKLRRALESILEVLK